MENSNIRKGKRMLGDNRGQINLISILGFIVILVFLASWFPTILGQQDLLIAACAGHPVEAFAAGTIGLVILIAFAQYILGHAQPTQPAGYY